MCLSQVYINIQMELKQQLIQWYNKSLLVNKITINTTQELSNGYIFTQILHNFNAKSIDLAQVYLKPKNQYEVLQNYKIINNCFAKLGWKKIDPQRYSKRKQKDYLSLGQMIKKLITIQMSKQQILSKRLSKSIQNFNIMDNEQQRFESDCQIKQKSKKIKELQQIKFGLLNKIMKIQMIIQKQQQQDCKQQLNNLKFLI